MPNYERYPADYLGSRRIHVARYSARRHERPTGRNPDVHSQTAEGHNVAIVRVPIEMYRPNRVRNDVYGVYDEWRSDVGMDDDNEDDRVNEYDQDEENEAEDLDAMYPLHSRQIQIIELCFHDDFQVRTGSPISLHFGATEDHGMIEGALYYEDGARNGPLISRMVTIWDPPPLIPQLTPPSFAIEYETLLLYPHIRQRQYRPQRRLRNNKAGKTTAWWHSYVCPGGLYVSILVGLSISILACLGWFGPCLGNGRRGRGGGGGGHGCSTQAAYDSAGAPLFVSHPLPYDVEDMLTLWAAIPAGILGMQEPRPRPGNPNASEGPELAWSPETFLGIHDSPLTPFTWTMAVSEASDPGVILRHIQERLQVISHIAGKTLYFAENHKFMPVNRDDKTTWPPHTYASFKQQCGRAYDHLGKADDLWLDVRSKAPAMVTDARIQVTGFLKRLDEIIKEIPFTELDHTFIDTSFDVRQDYIRQSILDGKGGEGTLPSLTSAILKAFHSHFVVASLPDDEANGDPDSGSRPPVSIYGGEETQYFARLCSSSTPETSGRTARPSHPICEQILSTTEAGLDPVSNLSAWLDWAAESLKLGQSEQQDKAYFEQPDLVALAGHLAMAHSLLTDSVLETVSRIPPEWIAYTWRHIEQDIDATSDPAYEHPSAAEESLRKLTTQLADQDMLRLTSQTIDVTRSLDAILEVQRRWSQVSSTVQGLMVMAKQDCEGDLSWRKDGRHFKIPSPEILVRIFGVLEKTLVTWEKATRDFHYAVLFSTASSGLFSLRLELQEYRS